MPVPPTMPAEPHAPPAPHAPHVPNAARRTSPLEVFGPEPSVGDAVPANYLNLNWEQRLAHVVETMRDMSRHTDPQEMVESYGRRMRGTLNAAHTISLSRRGLAHPLVRITRSTQWDHQPDPWREREKLPVIRGGILADLVYGDEPRLIDPFSIDPSDPAYEHLVHARSLVAVPHYENGMGVNMVLHTGAAPGVFAHERFPELVQLSNMFGRVTKNLALSRDLREAYDALDLELKSVQDIQLSLLPREMPAIPTLELATHYQTSKRAGGDYYDFFELPDNRWGLLVADVSGHGTPAAVLMAVVHAIAHLMPGEPWPPHRAMEYMNKALASRYTQGTGAFVTMIYAVYDAKARTLHYANAGHPQPLIRGTDGVIRTDDHPGAGMPLGIMADAAYGTREVQLRPGEALVLYTDGITEAFDADNRMFGEARLFEAIRRGASSACACPDAITSAIIEDVGNFAGLDSRSDDRTLVVGVVK